MAPRRATLLALAVAIAVAISAAAAAHPGGITERAATQLVATLRTQEAKSLLKLEASAGRIHATPCKKFVFQPGGKHSATETVLKCLWSQVASQGMSAFLALQLAHSYEGLGQTFEADTMLYEAAGWGHGEPAVDEWWYIGPFPVGKAEFDGDPLEAYGGIENVAFGNKQEYYSELAVGGKVTWQRLKQDNNRQFAVKPTVQWNDLVQAVGMEALEFQGWAIATLYVPSAVQAKVQCSGIHTVHVAGRQLVGDQYNSGNIVASIPLPAGVHTVRVHHRAKVGGSFACSVTRAAVDKLVLYQPRIVPQIVDSVWLSDLIAIPVFNPTNNRITDLQVVPTGISEMAFAPATPWFDLAPGQTVALPVRMRPTTAAGGSSTILSADGFVSSRKVSKCPHVFSLNVQGRTADGDFIAATAVKVTIECRRRSQSFLFTFLASDGSVQQAAAIAPQDGSPTSRPYPVLLTQHGTGVSAQSQADAYKYMPAGTKDYVFGVAGYWVVAPTRHGAHNWEISGYLTAMTAIMELAVHAAPDLPPLDPNRILFAGHSMGGHGAWVSAVTNADRAIAVSSAAGWIDKESYGDSNTFQRLDVSQSYLDARLGSVLAAALAPYRVDLFASHLQHVPVHTRVGSADRTVHPWFTRRMVRVLNAAGVRNVTLEELDGKEHWWWDTKLSNDGGVLNDPAMRAFYAAVKDLPSAASVGPKPIKDGLLVVANPSIGNCRFHVCVQQQLIPNRLSKVRVNRGADRVWTLATANVRQIVLARGVTAANVVKLVIDGESLPVDEVLASGACHSSRVWHACQAPKEGVVMRAGPTTATAYQVFNAPFLIVVGTNAAPEVVSVYREFAMYLANAHLMASDAVGWIVDDTQLRADVAAAYHLVLLGGPAHNNWTAHGLRGPGLEWAAKNDAGFDTWTIGDCQYSAAGLGLLALRPLEGDRVALVAAGTDIAGVRSIMRLAEPTIPPMVRAPFTNQVPDYVVLSESARWTGWAGYVEEFAVAGRWFSLVV